jgi:phenylpyruvate tautomerase PptA (4-oxalocrotonate tautomerase family)
LLRRPSVATRPPPSSFLIFAGRTLEAKRSLYRGIVENLESLGIPRDHVKILLREIPREDWGIRGGQAGSDIDLGFDAEV